jgi:hypothetical protein
MKMIDIVAINISVPRLSIIKYTHYKLNIKPLYIVRLNI